MNWSRIKNALIREIRKSSKKRNWFLKDIKISIAEERKKILIKNGFFPSSDLVLDFQKFGFNSFLNDRDYAKLYPINHPSISTLIDYKSYLPILLGDKKEWLPDFFAFCSRGSIIFQKGIPNKLLDLELFLKSALDAFGNLIVKPISDGGGRGIFLLTKENFDQIIKDLIKKDFVINNVLKNNQFLSDVFPGCLNTTRVTFYKNASGQNEILMIAQKFGTSLSSSVDNISKGGMACSIDPQSGEMSKAYTYSGKPGWYAKHLDSGKQIAGVKFPDWENCYKQIQEIVNHFDFLEFAGIDLAFTDKGIKIIEINSQPEARLTQVGGPILLNPGFNEFIKNKGYQPNR
ncbi:MAG: sugar-transfer associated ATP-grasp domain-containing protein [Algoriphagus sp.]|uniref:sugar-transfer associated ATP-grasp domain-containing protein n=1 Tax=Algoriphagus sp. TaxID=1872435 RepID=UPI0026151E6F|nr:sugar-transfer associated ATP-grasp domain-containing protein [Algoriphagus sp.]MDG1276905.1 sugar-transfer associated ATP-grasp domain-containing protein [Algoriphagus sp.]